jgi:hypothetical protein
MPSPAGTTVSTPLLNGVTVTIGHAATLAAVGEFQINFTMPQLRHQSPATHRLCHPLRSTRPFQRPTAPHHL